MNDTLNFMAGASFLSLLMFLAFLAALHIHYNNIVSSEKPVPLMTYDEQVACLKALTE